MHLSQPNTSRGREYMWWVRRTTPLPLPPHDTLDCSSSQLEHEKHSQTDKFAQQCLHLVPPENFSQTSTFLTKPDSAGVQQPHPGPTCLKVTSSTCSQSSIIQCRQSRDTYICCLLLTPSSGPPGECSILYHEAYSTTPPTSKGHE